MPDRTPRQSPASTAPVSARPAGPPPTGSGRARTQPKQTEPASIGPAGQPHRRPLPDAVAIRSIAVPVAAPALDDYGAADRAASKMPRVRTRQPTSAGGRPASAGQTKRARQLACAAAALEPSAASAGVPSTETARRRMSVAEHWPSQFAQILAETLAGTRPPNQIAPWTTAQARKRISQLSPAMATAHQPRVKRVIVRSPADGVLELAVIVKLGSRIRALAVRLERDRPAIDRPDLATDPGPAHRIGPATPTARTGESGRWFCTAIEAA
jgi:uncharacterized protein DUF6459